jgi:hypothetical protein
MFLMFAGIYQLFIHALLSLHPYFISMTDINYNSKTQSIEVSVRIFTDDFEKTLRKNCNCKVDLLNPQEKKGMTALANAYILKRLQIKINEQPVYLEPAGYEQEDESIWNYYQAKNVTQVKKIEVNNSLLHDYKEEQINMIHIKVNGKEATDKLDYPKTFYSMNF